MKELDNIPRPDEIKIHNQRQVESSTILDSIVPHKGHTTFEIDCTTGEITPATYQAINAEFNGAVRKKIIVRENCLYISCLNIKSARKKYVKWMTEKLMNNIKKAINDQPTTSKED